VPDTVSADTTVGNAQVTRVPTGGVQAGGGTTGVVQHPALLGTGLALLVAAVVTGTRRRTEQSASHQG
jgi:SNF family Na+-dependent transporter